ncbi:uncharacterized, partial [Tachysurus ichikawai]
SSHVSDSRPSFSPHVPDVLVVSLQKSLRSAHLLHTCSPSSHDSPKPNARIFSYMERLYSLPDDCVKRKPV